MDVIIIHTNYLRPPLAKINPSLYGGGGGHDVCVETKGPDLCGWGGGIVYVDIPKLFHAPFSGVDLFPYKTN